MSLIAVSPQESAVADLVGCQNCSETGTMAKLKIRRSAINRRHIVKLMGDVALVDRI
jgi:hypothetical protein